MPRIRTHPGEVLEEEFMIPLNLSARQLADQIDVPANRITAIINAERSVTADTAIRFGHRFGTTAQFWLNLQDAHNLSLAEAQNDYSKVRRVEEFA